MEIFTIAFYVIKYSLLFLISFVLYMAYIFIWQSYAIRRKYKQYKNIVMSKSYQPFLGEHAVIRKLIRENKYVGYYQMEDIMNNPDCDIRLTFSGKQPYFHLTSVSALNDFKSLVPEKIDRWDYAKKNFGRMSIGSLDQRRSDNNWKQRREAIMKTIGINFASKFIPLMLDKIEKVSNAWEVGEWIEFNEEMRTVTFEIITDILFGKGIKQKIGKLRYKDFKGEVVEKDLQEFFLTLTKDTFAATTKIQSILFPFLIHNNLFYPNNIVHENVETLWAKVREFLEKGNV